MSPPEARSVVDKRRSVSCYVSSLPMSAASEYLCSIVDSQALKCLSLKLYALF